MGNLEAPAAGSELHDPHASKMSPDDPRLRIKRLGTRRLRKSRLLAALCCVALIVASGLAYATTSSPRREKKGQSFANTARAVVPEAILRGPDRPPPSAAPKPAPILPPSPTASDDADESEDAAEEPRPARFSAPAEADRNDPYSAKALRRKRLEAYWAARGAGVLVDVGPMPQDDVSALGLAGAEESGVIEPPNELPTVVGESGHGMSSGVTPGDPNMQLRKSEFLEAAGKGRDDGYLHARLQRPRSPYEVKAGTIIPAVLQTGINSDLPGPIFAKVREDVYDSVSHDYLLIPQNSTLVAAYDSMVAWGQERVLMCWHRLILPNGSSMQLECMPGGDLAGAAGLTDRVDEHWWRIIKGVAVSSLLSAATTAAAGNTTGYNPTVPQMWAHGAASEIASAGEAITRRNINIQPTITIRPGWSLNVLVTKDMILEPYDATR
jgi:type IV secretory pathway VirB10-like protein